MTRVDRQLRPDVQLQQRDQREVSEVSRHQPRVQQVRLPASPEFAANPAEPDLLFIFKIFASPTKYSNQKNVLDAAEAAALKETKCLEEVRNC